jgi:hypothetical protein
MGMKPSTRPVSIELVRSLLKKSVRDLRDAATPGLSSESVFTFSSRKPSVRYYLAYGHF